MSRSSRWAAVAIAVGPPPERAILLVRRSARPSDPWSGDWAFPGGFSRDGDVDPADTARREAREEVGIALGPADRALRPMWVFDPYRRRPARLVPVVFEVGADVVLAPLALDPREIAAARWLPSAALADRRREWLWIRGRVPWWAAVRRFDGGRERVWGLTGAMLDRLGG